MRKFIFTLMVMGLLISAPAFAQNFDEIAPKEAQKAAMPDQQPVAASNAGECVDDPRLQTDIVEIMESNAPVKPLLTVTPETFLNMDEEAVTALGGKMMVCPNNPVLKNGKTMKKVQMDFAPLWANIRKTAADGNEAQLKKLLDNFRALPMPSEEVVKLFVPINMEDKAAKTLFSVSGMAQSKFPDNYPNRVVEFYTLLGGKANDNIPTYVNNFIGPETRAKINDENNGKVIFMLGQTKDTSNEKIAVEMLKAAGVNAIMLQ